jgi:Fe-S cluster assembly iron-binding protein IscA
LLALASVFFVAIAPAKAQVKLNASAAPSAGQPDVQMIKVTGSGFPSGAIPQQNVTVSFVSAVPQSGPSAATKASAVATLFGTTRTISFQIPSALATQSPISYLVSISGTTSSGVSFSSSNPSSLTINPAASVGLSPASGQPGQTVNVVFTGKYTNFIQVSTQANFGPGISVGGGAPGQYGPLTVTNSTLASASLVISASASTGVRTITVATGVQQATVQFTVNSGAPMPTSITVTPPFTRATAGSMDQFTATGHYSDGSMQNLTSAATWNSSNTAALTISNTAGTHGLATHVAIGSTRITATMSGVTSSPAFSLTVAPAVLAAIAVTAPLTSVAVGNTDQFTATGHYSDGSTQDLTSTATWNSTNTAAATISNTAGTQGLARSVATGNTNITASMNGVTSSPVFSLTVAAAVLKSITVTAPLTSVAAGNTDQFIATGHYSDGSTQYLTSAATWNSTNTAVATISNSEGARGLVTGVAIGSTNITASMNGVTSSPVFSLTVTAVALTSITVTAPLSSVVPGSTDQFTATGHYSDGSTPDLTSAATWNSSNTAVATISNTVGTQGLATGVAIGSTDITASMNGVTSSADTLTVSHGFVPTIGSLNVARQNHTATLLTNGKVLIAGGYDINGNALASAELYDPITQLFTLTGSLKTARLYHTATLLNNGMVLIAGGATQPAGGQSLASAELYDPAHGTFTSTGSMNSPRAAATATVVDNGKVLIAGGSAVGGREGGALASAELYDPATGTFTPTGSMTAGRNYHTATLLNNGMVLIAGGFSYNFTSVLASAEQYDPATGTFTPTGSMTTARAYTSTATLLDNGMVLIAEGVDLYGSLASAELYDPGTGTFILTAPATLPAGGISPCTWTLLNNGMVLYDGACSLFDGSHAGLYDPTTQLFTSIGTTLNDYRSNHTATRLNNGMVLVAGGNDANLGIVATAELYEPDTLTPTGLVSIAVRPLDPTIPVGSDQRFVATGTFSDGSTERLASVTWISSSSAVATVTSDSSNHGAAHAVATGSATVSACDGSVCGSATLRGGVNGGMLTSITVTAPSPSVVAGSTDQFNATGHYSDGSTQDLTSTATWNSTNTAVATISNTVGAQGLATGVAIGSTKITASTNGVTSSPVFSLTVTAVVLTSITVTAPFTSVAPGSTDQFNATGHYSDGSMQNLTSAATWNSSNAAAATISNTPSTHGLATGVATGSTNITASLNGVTSGADTLAVASGFSFGLVPTGSMNAERYFHTATLLTNGKVLIAGGIRGIDCCGNIGHLASAELYDPAAGTFTLTGSMAAARIGHTATLLNNGTVLITGGINSVAILSGAEIYNPSSGSFTSAGSMINAREGHVATLLKNGKVLITGGSTNLGFIANAELYDPAAGTFTPTGSMTTARGNLTATLLNNGKVLIADSGSSELYDPATSTFIPTVSNVQSGGTATLLNNGLVLFAGEGVGGVLAELYDPATDTFTPTGSANSGETATTLLSNGMVLFTASMDDLIANLELYDPTTGTFTPSGVLTPGRGLSTATLLSNGMVLIAGGHGAGNDNGLLTFAFAYLYEPATLTPPGLVSIAVSPLSPTISPGTSRRLIATGTFSDGSTEQLASVTWSSSNNAVATITNDASNEGAAFGAALGTSTIKACTGLVCGSTTLTVSGTAGVGAAASIAAAGGGGQSATVSTAFATPLQVIVEDASDNLVPNATVTFTAPAGGAGGTFANGMATTTAVTNSSGVAAASAFTASSTSGAYSVTASVSGVSTTANFSLTNTPGLLASIIATGGSAQSATISAAFATPLQAVVLDASGNLSPNATVTFTAPASGASGTFANHAATTTAVTNSSGVATASAFTANSTPGVYSVTASVPGVITTASFSLTNTTSALASIVATGGGGQSATVSTPFATALQVTLKNASGNLVPNVAVTFTAPASGAGGTFANGMATTAAVTNSSGIAMASAFLANRIAGAYSVTASVPGMSTTASFSLTNTPGAPASIVAAGGGGQSATVSTPFATALQAVVLDVSGNLIPNVTVTFIAPASGASGKFANGTATTTAVTNSSGVATASAFTANSTPGAYSVTASVPGVSTKDSFSLTNDPGLPPGATGLVVTETLASQPVLGGGAIVLVDGIWSGNTDSSGSLTTPVTPGSHTVTILDLAGARGDVSAVAVAGMSTPVVVDVHDSEAIYAPGTSSIPQIAGGIFNYLDATKNPITVQFLDVASNPVIVTVLSSVYLEDNVGDVVDLSAYTTITGNGTLLVNLDSALQSLGLDTATIAAKGPFLMEYSVKDANGVPYEGRPQFGLGVFSIRGTVQAPPSNPALPVGNVQLSFQNDSGVVLQAASGAGGAFTIGGVPPDTYNVQASFTSGGVIYTVQGTAVVQGDAVISAVPLGPFDIWNNVVSVTTTPALGAALAPAISNGVASSATTNPIPGFRRSAPAIRHASRPALGRSAAVSNPSSGLATVPSTSQYGPSITNGPTNTDLCLSLLLCSPSAFGEDIWYIPYTISKGTPFVDVVYRVCTNQSFVGPVDEAGVWVGDANGGTLFEDVEYVYAQSTSPFVFKFQPDGCTAVFQHATIDISALTSSSAATITLYVYVADSITNLITPVSTFVTAILEPPLTIRAFTLDPFQSSCASLPVNEEPNNPSTFNRNNIAPCLMGSGASKGEYVSVPLNTADNCVSGIVVGNCFDRPATAFLDSPPDIPLTIDNVELDLVDVFGNTLDTIFNEAPGGRVVLSDSKTTLKLSSIGYLASSGPDFGVPNLASNALPSQVQYLLTVTGTQGGNTFTATKYLQLTPSQDVTVFNTLWSAVNAGVSEPRYGDKRDIGGDDWATLNTIKWLTANVALITSFNDISGEHGRNIGHHNHAKGTDVDIFQFVNLCNCINGSQNYTALEDATNHGLFLIFVIDSFPGSGNDPLHPNLSRLNTLINFVMQNRMKIDALSTDMNASPNIVEFYFGLGNETDWMAEGWLKFAMKDGMLHLRGGEMIDLKIGPWKPKNNKPIHYTEEHNNHIHIGLGNF